MSNKKLVIAITAAFALAGCDSDSETVLAPKAPSVETFPSDIFNVVVPPITLRFGTH